ncbi:MAG: LytTR family DNA-binding domain-containing protein [Bacteroidota bacterium]
MGEELHAIIIDDDPSCHRLLSGIIEDEHEDVQLQGNAYSVKEGIKLIKDKNPDLIFLDIELPDGLGFKVLESFPNPQFRVIFITAHNEYALTAIRFEALDFLEKPLDEDAIEVALEKARRFQNRIINQDQIANLLENYERAKSQRLPTRLAIPSQKEITFLQVENIMWLDADVNCTWFYVSGQEKPVLSTSHLGSYIEKFEPYDAFHQVHRSHLLNLNYVSKINKTQRVAILEGGKEVGIARRYWDSFKEAMGRL